MAEEESNQEKTEEPTARRLEKSREDGQVPRSKELSMATIMIASAGLMVFYGGQLITDIGNVVISCLQVDQETIFNTRKLPAHFLQKFADGLMAFSPLYLVTFVMTLATPGLIGGWIFSMKAAKPKFSKINPLKGLKKIFGINAVMELIKAIAKFSLVGGIAFLIVSSQIDQFLTLGSIPLERAFAKSGELLAWSFLYMCLGLVLIALIDVPYQIHTHVKKLKMSLQEIKDELKDVEGRPEVKQHIRQKQHEMATARMLEDVPSADVLIVNPEHFAVALTYDRNSEGAPVLVAKGADEIAKKILEIAQEHKIQILRIPLLARALFFTTEVKQEIPDSLYTAVAQVLAYVFQLNELQAGAPRPAMPSPTVPDDFQFDPEGNPIY
jgi:flagellar biosynthetic protein FlhB